MLTFINTIKNSPNRNLLLGYALLLSLGLYYVFKLSGLTAGTFETLWNLVFIGIGAATIANATGMGGGVVFLPVFELLSDSSIISITTAQIIGMSFVIQSFGMTTGSVTWLYKIYNGNNDVDTGIAERDFWKIIIVVLIFAIPSMLITQYYLTLETQYVLFLFKSFSLILGIKLLFAAWLSGKLKNRTHQLSNFDIWFLVFAGLLGGVATALFSVGVGEIVALYLFIRNFPLVTCAATAVILSATTVLIGLPFHLFNTDLPWQILAIVIPGAIFGGYIARPVAYFLGNMRLKILAAMWIILSSGYMLFYSVH